MGVLKASRAPATRIIFGQTQNQACSKALVASNHDAGPSKEQLSNMCTSILYTWAWKKQDCCEPRMCALAMRKPPSLHAAV